MTGDEVERLNAEERVVRLEHIVAEYGRNIAQAVTRKARTEALSRGLAGAELRLAAARRARAAL